MLKPIAATIAWNTFSSCFCASALAVMSACFALPGHCLDPEPPKTLPTSEWSWIPEWSHNGRFVKVNWPKPHYPSAEPNPKWEKSLILKVPSNEVLPLRIPIFTDGGTWSPDDKMIAGDTNIYSIATGKVVLPYQKYGAIAWSQDSKFFASGTGVWDIVQKKKLFTFPGRLDWIRPKLAWSRDGRKIAHALSRADGWPKEILRVYSATGERLLSLRTKNPIEDIGWSTSLNLFAYSDDALHILDGNSLKELKTLRPANQGQVNFNWSPDGKLVAYSGEGADLHIYDAEKMQERFVTEAEKTGRFHMKWSPVGDYLLLQGADDTLAIFNAVTGKYAGAKKFDCDFSVARWAPDGKSLTLTNFSNDSVVIVPVRLQAGESAFDKGIDGDPWRDQKVLRNIEDCFEALNKMLSADVIAQIKSSTEDKLCMFQGGPGLGMWLRNKWGLRQSNPLTLYFNKMGIVNGANMSSLIIELYWRHLNNKPLNLEERALAIKLDEDNNRYIIAEDKPLPAALLNSSLKTFDGKSSSIEQLKGKAKIVSFIPDNDYSSIEMLKVVASVRSKYPADKVAVLVIKVPQKLFLPESSVKPGNAIDAAEFMKIEKANQSSMTVVATDAETFALFKSFVGERVKNPHRMLPQTLILTENNAVATRINGSVSERNTLPIEDAVDAVLGDSARLTDL